MQRVIWKGSLSFGLVSCPVSVVTAEAHDELSFTQLDKRDNSPIGYKKYNKSTGKDVPAGQIVKGYELENGNYVVLTDEDFRRANVKATQTVDIHQFANLDEIDPAYFEKPYYLVPQKEGLKAYQLFYKTLLQSRKVAIATVVIHTRQYLAAVLPRDEMLVLELMRFAHGLKRPEDITMPQSTGARPSANEIKMAQMLIDSMSAPWQPEKYKDEYRNDLMALIREKSKSKKAAPRQIPKSDSGDKKSSKPLDLAALLKESLQRSGKKAS